MAKLPRKLWDECRSTAECKASTLNYKDLSVLLLELALEKESDPHLNAYRPGALGAMAVGIRDTDLDRGLPQKMLVS